MDRKKKIYKIINICIIVIAIIYINASAWITLLDNPEFITIIQNINLNNIGEIIKPISMSYFFSTMVFMFGPFGLFITGYIIYRVIKSRAIRKNRKHPKFDIEYFRDYLNKVSPACVSYLIDFELDLDRDVSAHLLKLQLDGYIEEQNGIFKVTQKDQTNLKSSDIILLDFIESNFRDTSKLYQYKNVIVNEMVDEKYIKYTFEKGDFKKFATLFVTLQFITFTSPILVSVLLSSDSPVFTIIFSITLVLGSIMMISTPVILIAKVIIYIKWGAIKRTEKGNMLLEQIYGLKKFLEDFTNIDDSNLNEVHLREYYLVYAVVLGVNDIAGDTMLEKIKKQMNQNR